MKDKIQSGQLKRIIPLKGGGLTGEVHLLNHNNKKFIVRRCETIEIAKKYVKIYHTFKKYGFFPKLLGRYGKDVVFEYIEGRHIRKNEPLIIYEKLGIIAAQINKASADQDYKKRFFGQLKEIEEGIYENVDKKVLERRRINKEVVQSQKVITKIEAIMVKKVFEYLDKTCKPQTSWDANDFNATNFMITPKKQVYFVDIEALKPRIKGFGIAKAMHHILKTKSQQKRFLQGYSSVSPIDFLTEEYRDFLTLMFMVQKINYRFKIYKKGEYEVPLKGLKEIVKKYSHKL